MYLHISKYLSLLCIEKLWTFSFLTFLKHKWNSCKWCSHSLCDKSLGLQTPINCKPLFSSFSYPSYLFLSFLWWNQISYFLYMCKSSVLFVYLCPTLLIYHKYPLLPVMLLPMSRPRILGLSNTTFYALLNYFYPLIYRLTQLDSITRLLCIAWLVTWVCMRDHQHTILFPLGIPQVEIFVDLMLPFVLLLWGTPVYTFSLFYNGCSVRGEMIPHCNVRVNFPKSEEHCTGYHVQGCVHVSEYTLFRYFVHFNWIICVFGVEGFWISSYKFWF